MRKEKNKKHTLFQLSNLLLIAQLVFISNLGAVGVFIIPKTALAQATPSAPTFIFSVSLPTADPTYATNSQTNVYPGGIAADSSSNIYFNDSSWQNIIKLGSTGTYSAQWTAHGETDGANGMAMDHSGNIYIANEFQQSVQEFDSNGNILNTWSGVTSGANFPYGVAVDGSGNIWVITSNNVVKEFASGGGSLITQWSDHGANGIALSPDGSLVYLTDPASNALQVDVYSTSGTDLRAVNGTGSNTLNYPEGVAVDSAGNIYVVDNKINNSPEPQGRVEEFSSISSNNVNSGGTYLTEWGDSGTNQFSAPPYGPTGIAVDASGKVYVNDRTDINNARVMVFAPAPTISAISPNYSPTTSGGAVTITGNTFYNNSANGGSDLTVTIGSNVCTGVNITAPNSLTCTAPNGTVGAQDVVVTTQSGSATLTGGYTYFSTPTISSIYANSGPTTGNNNITITGTNFYNGTSNLTVTIGGNACSGVTIASPTGLSCTVPAGTAGAQDVVLTTESGSVTDTGGYTYTSSVEPISFCKYTQIATNPTGGHSLGLRDDGTVLQWGYTQTQAGTGIATPVSGLSSVNITAVAAGFNHGLALDSNGNVWAWGSNDYGQLGNGSIGDLFTYVSPVEVVGTDYGTNANSKLSGIIAIAAGNNDSYALKSDGTVYAWGDDSVGQLGNGTTGNGGSTANSGVPVQVLAVGATAGSGSYLTGITTIAAGSFHALANAGGTVLYAWGENSTGQLGDGTTTERDTPVAVSGLPVGITSIAGGSLDSLASANGTAFAWGSNSFGQLGNGTTTESDTPVEVTGLLSGVTYMSGGIEHSLAIANGTLYAWGGNQSGELGNGTTTQSSTPVQPSLPNGVTISNISAGGDYSLALDNNGNLVSWGTNNLGQLGDGSTSNNPISTAVQTLAPCITPNQGLTVGGDTVNITGHGFLSGATVTFDGNLAGQNPTGTVTVNSSTSITATTPAHVPGLVDVKVQNTNNQSATQTNGFSYEPLAVTTITPSDGSTAGGTTVTINGTDFLQGATVTIGGTATTINSISQDGTTIMATTPPGTAGAVDVVVTNPNSDNQSPATLPGGFTYVQNAAPCSTGPVNGGHGLPGGGGIPGGGHGAANYGFADILLAQVIPPDGGGGHGYSLADKGCSTITATSPVAADGNSKTFIIVTINDSTNSAVQGIHVKVKPSDTTLVTGTIAVDCASPHTPIGGTLPAVGTTNGSGQACFTAVASSPGNETFTGTVVSNSGLFIGNITQQAMVAFISPGASCGFTNITTGFLDNLALKADGTVWAWGSNDSAQLGYTPNPSSNQYSDIPTQVNITNIVGIASGRDHSMALKSDGTVYTWGVNTNGQLGYNSSGGVLQNSADPVQVDTNPPTDNDHADSDGFLHNVKAIAAGQLFSLALKNDGTVWAWGQNNQGQIGNNTTADQNYPVQVLTGSGGPLQNIVAIAAGQNHALAVDNNGNVWAWGRNSEGELGNNDTSQSLTAVEVVTANGQPLQNAASVSAGNNFSIALLGDHTVWTWGNNLDENGDYAGELGYDTRNGGNTPPSANFSQVAAQVTDPADSSGFIQNVASVSAGRFHSEVLKEDGTVWTWGSNDAGQLGLGTTDTSTHIAPARVDGLNNISAIAAGRHHSLALSSTGASTTWAWGSNTNNTGGAYSGQLGRGPTDTADHSSPVVVLTNFTCTDTPPACTGLTNDQSCATASITGGTIFFSNIPKDTAFTSAQNNTSLPSFNDANGTTANDVMSVTDLRNDPTAGFEVQLSASNPDNNSNNYIFVSSNDQNFIPLDYVYVLTSLPSTSGATEDQTNGIEYEAGCVGATNNITSSVKVPEPLNTGDLGILSNFTTYGSKLGTGNTPTPVVLMSSPASARRCTMSEAVSYATDLPSYITQRGSNIPSGTYTVTFTYTLIPNSGGGSGGGSSDLDASGAFSSALSSTTSLANPVAENGLDTSGNFAYFSEPQGNQIVSYDLSNNLSPSLVSTTSTPYTPGTIKISGNYAYVAGTGGSNQLMIYDIATTPGTPIYKGHIGVGTDPIAIDILDNVNNGHLYAYVANQTSANMSIVDVTDPTNPSLITTYTPPTTGSTPAINGIAVGHHTGTNAGDYAYFSFTQTSPNQSLLDIINITDPTNPTFTTSFDVNAHGSANAYDVRLTPGTDIVWVGNLSTGALNQITVSDPANPVWAGEISGVNVRRFDLYNNLLFFGYTSNNIPSVMAGNVQGNDPNIFTDYTNTTADPSYAIKGIGSDLIFPDGPNTPYSFEAMNNSVLGQSFAYKGKDIVYTVPIHNLGPDTAANVKIDETPLPAGTTFVSVSALGGGAISCTSLPCNLGTYSANENDEVLITLHVDPSYSGSSLSNTFTLSSDSTDPNQSNNAVSITSTVLASAGGSGSLPTAPTQNNPTTASSQAGLSWTDSDSSITDYKIIYGDSSSCTPPQTFSSSPTGCSVQDTSSTSLSTTINGLNNGTVYNFAIYSVNSFGTSDASNIKQGTPGNNPSLQLEKYSYSETSTTNIDPNDTGSTSAQNPTALDVKTSENNTPYAYIVNQTNPKLDIFDVTAPNTPVFTGNVVLPAAATDIKVLINPFGDNKNYAYIGTSSSLVVADVTDPTNPNIIGTVDLTSSGGVTRLAILPNASDSSKIYVYATQQSNNSVAVMDISNPSSPSLLTTITNGQTYGAGASYVSGPIAIEAAHHSIVSSGDANAGDYIYYTNDGDNSIGIVQVDTPASPNFATKFSIPVNCGPVDMLVPPNNGGSEDRTSISCSNGTIVTTMSTSDPHSPQSEGLNTFLPNISYGTLGTLISDNPGQYVANSYISDNNNHIAVFEGPEFPINLTPHGSPTNKYMVILGNYIYFNNFNDSSFSAVNVSTLGQSQAYQNQTINYVLEIDNFGDPSNGTVVTDTMPSNISASNSFYLEGSNQGSCSGTSSTVTCNLGLIPFSLAHAFVNILGTVNSSTPNPTTNSAHITTTDSNNTANASLSTIIEVGGPNPITDLSNSPSPGINQMHLSWSAPNDNGSIITDYYVAYGLNSTCTPATNYSSSMTGCTTLDTGSTSASATVTGLTTYSPPYNFAVYAVNANGVSTVSNIVSGEPQAP